MYTTPPAADGAVVAVQFLNGRCRTFEARPRLVVLGNRPSDPRLAFK
jgi:hypothetical protein